MLAHYGLTLYRSLSRHRLYAAINILGLAVGIAVFMVMFLEVRFETSFERWIPDANHIYVVRSEYSGFGALNQSEGDLLDKLRIAFPKLVAARISDDRVYIIEGGALKGEAVARVDPTFLSVFDPPFVAGDPKTALSRPDDLILSQSKARSVLGTEAAVGRTLTLNETGGPKTYRVTAIMKDAPSNTDPNFKWDLITPLTAQIKANDFWRQKDMAAVYNFVKSPSRREAAAVEQEIVRLSKPARGDTDKLWADMLKHIALTPIADLHLIDPVAKTAVAAFAAVGLLTLLLAAVNYVNLATARAAVRAREVAIRKVMGATGGALIVQFLGEALATVALSALMGLALCELALPIVNAAGGLSLRLDYLGGDSLLPMVAIVVLVVGLGAGAYPALVLSRYRPARVLASVRTPGGGRGERRVREGLVLVQFAIAIAFTIATTVIVSQMGFLRQADLGFRREGLITVSSFGEDEVSDPQRASLLAAWRGLPGTMSLTASSLAPADDSFKTAEVIENGSKAQVTVNDVRIDPGFFATYGARVLAGRILDPAFGDDFYERFVYRHQPTPEENKHEEDVARRHPNSNVVLNAAAVRALGFRSPQDAIGRKFGHRQSIIVGVIQNIRFGDPRTPVPPTVYLGQSNMAPSPWAAVRYSAADPKPLLALMKASWTRIVPATPFKADTAAAGLESAYYEKDDRQGRLFAIVSALAVAIGCVGLYGLASFNTARRVKEIGIRKTLGASTSDILKLLIGQFLRPVVIANLFAWPLAWWAMTRWLSGFDQRIALSPLYFLAATALTLLIAVATVAGQAYAVARAEPAKALRHE